MQTEYVLMLWLAKVKEYMVKSFNEGMKQNAAWVGAIAGYELKGVDIFENAVDMINGITPADIQKFMKEVMKQGNFQIYLMAPEN